MRRPAAPLALALAALALTGCAAAGFPFDPVAAAPAPTGAPTGTPAPSAEPTTAPPADLLPGAVPAQAPEIPDGFDGLILAAYVNPIYTADQTSIGAELIAVRDGVGQGIPFSGDRAAPDGSAPGQPTAAGVIDLIALALGEPECRGGAITGWLGACGASAVEVRRLDDGYRFELDMRPVLAPDRLRVEYQLPVTDDLGAMTSSVWVDLTRVDRRALQRDDDGNLFMQEAVYWATPDEREAVLQLQSSGIVARYQHGETTGIELRVPEPTATSRRTEPLPGFVTSLSPGRRCRAAGPWCWGSTGCATRTPPGRRCAPPRTTIRRAPSTC